MRFLRELEEFEDPKARKTDRVLVIKPIEGKRVTSSTGLIDTRLFSGQNKLHAIKTPPHGLWKLKYEMGGLPDPLKQSFTSFYTLMKFVTYYFEKRGLYIEEVID